MDVVNPGSIVLQAGVDWLSGKLEVLPDDVTAHRRGAPREAHYDLCKLLGVAIDRWEFTTPRKGYTKAVEFLGAKLSWSLLDSDRDLARFDMSASALAAWEVAGYIKDVPTFIAHLHDNGVVFDRVDGCLDEINGNLDIRVLTELCAEGSFSTKVRKWRPYCATRDTCENDYDSDTLYIGSKGSDKQMRIYDKRDESRPAGIGRAAWRASHPRHIRVELQCRDESADAFAALISKLGVAVAVKGAIRQFVEFKESVRNHRSRSLAPTHPMWAAFLGAGVKLRLAVVPGEMTVHSVLRWIKAQCGPSLRMIGQYEAMHGRDRYFWVRTIMQDAPLRRRHANMLALAGLQAGT